MAAEIIQFMKHKGAGAQRRDAASRRFEESPDLRRARIRILQLEASLTAALRDSVRHHDRAQDAERRLREIENLETDSAEPA